MGRWHRNYYHWLLYHLPRIMLLQEQGVERRILIPEAGRLGAVIEASLTALGVDPAGLREAVAGPMRADPLWIVEADRFDPVLLRQLRSRIVRDVGAPSRRVYVSRERTARRRLANPEAVLGPLGGAGFDAVKMEELTFAEQVALAARTEILMGVHGAGLTNMLFMPEGAHVVEFSNPRYPSPAFYALAAALGLRYWLVLGRPREERGPGTLDVEVDPRDVERVMAAIERQR
jgi:capsular polysaccharide biosynthesis protein